MFRIPLKLKTPIGKPLAPLRTFKILRGNQETVQYVADMSAIPRDVNPPNVVIIGAGVAGLSVAQRLVQCGITSFRILEATERAGGRVKTCWLADTITELGAEYIHGASIANPIYTLAAQEKLFKVPLDRKQNSDGLLFSSDGLPIGKGTLKRVAEKFLSMEAKAASLFRSDAHLDDSLAGYFEQLVCTDLENEMDRYNAARTYFGLMNELSARVGAQLTMVSAKFFGSQDELPGGTVKVPLGMGGILAPLVRGLPHCSEVYCKPVHCIKWGAAGAGDPRAVIRCCDGEEWCADFVVVTVPLGVLKKNADTLFCPPLPSNKMDAIKNLGFGHLAKVYLEYCDPFWTGDWGFGLAWSPEELETKDSWVTGISSFNSISKKVLGVTIAGESGSQMERCTDAEVADHVTIVLRRFLSDTSIPRPAAVMRTDWSSSPYFYGGVTYMGLESGPGNVKDIAEPIPSDCDDIPPILLFAGEHTHPRFYGTLHGARLSGIREANRIVELTKKYKGSPTKAPPC